MRILGNVRRVRTAILGLALAGVFAFGSHLNASRLFIDCIVDPGQCDGCDMAAYDCESCTIYAASAIRSRLRVAERTIACRIELTCAGTPAHARETLTNPELGQ
jgi:hypothetical protein